MEHVLEAALVGTAHQAPASVEEPWGEIAAPDAERALLLRAGAWAVYRQAGKIALPAPPAIAPAPDEPLPPLGARGEALLKELLGEHAHQPIAIAALHRMADMGLRLPHAMLPELLATQPAELRRALLPVIGARGAWLAQFRQDWAWALPARVQALDPAENHARWAEGTASERLAVIALVHAHDRAMARAWLEEALPREKADQRVKLLEAIAPTLAPDDEPFLEGLLGDRSGPVRALAGQLLARLPASALTRRMIARADALVTGSVARNPLQLFAKLSVTLPPDLPEDWARDGITDKPPPGVGAKAWILRQIVALVPPAHWESRFGAPPEAIAAAVAKTDEAAVLIEALAEAALMHRASAWLPPLGEALVRRLIAEARHVSYTMIPQAVLGAIADPALQADMVARLAKETRLETLPWLTLMPAPWCPALAECFIERLGQRLKDLAPERYQYWNDPWIGVLDHAHLGLPPEALPRLEPLLASMPEEGSLSPLRHRLDQLCHALTLRQRIQKEIAP